jgi:hypothetical protein
MKECDNEKAKQAANFVWSIYLLIMLDTLLLRHSLHFTTLHPTTLHYTSPHFTQLHFATLHYTSPNYTSLHFTTLHPTTLHSTSQHLSTLHLSRNRMGSDLEIEDFTIPRLLFSHQKHQLSNTQNCWQFDNCHCPRYRSNWTGVQNCSQRYTLVEISGVRNKMGPIIPIALIAHHTPAVTNNGISWINLGNLSFWGFTHPVVWNQVSLLNGTTVRSNSSRVSWGYQFRKFGLRSVS